MKPFTNEEVIVAAGQLSQMASMELANIIMRMRLEQYEQEPKEEAEED